MSTHYSQYFSFLFFSSFCLLGLHQRDTEVPRPGVQSELQLLAYTRLTAMRNLSRVCSKAGSLTHSLVEAKV